LKAIFVYSHSHGRGAAFLRADGRSVRHGLGAYAIRALSDLSVSAGTKPAAGLL